MILIKEKAKKDLLKTLGFKRSFLCKSGMHKNIKTGSFHNTNLNYNTIIS